MNRESTLIFAEPGGPILCAMTSSTASGRSIGAVAVAVLAAAAHLVVGFFYLLGGLAIPGHVLLPLWALWVGLTVWLVRLAARRSWWTPAVPVVAAAVYLLVITVGDQVLGWQA